MANPTTLTPYGFLQYQGGAGGAATFAQTARRVASTAGAIYAGDPVQPVVSTANGYIIQGTGSTTVCAGIFSACKYLSTAVGRTVWANYWPGSGATGDVEAYIVDDPNSRWRAQGNSTTFNITGTLSTYTSSPVGQYAQYTIGTGTSTGGYGKSGAYLSSVNTTVTFPFIVVDLVTAPPGASGADPTTAFNDVIVGFNNEWLRTNGAGPTGIS